MSALKEAYPNNEIQFNENEKSVACITKKINKAFERLKLGEFNKWKVASILVDRIEKDSNENKISNDTCKIFEENLYPSQHYFKNKVIGKVTVDLMNLNDMSCHVANNLLCRW